MPHLHKRSGMEIRMKKGKRRILPGAALTALAAAVIVYCILISIEKNALAQYEKDVVWVARKEIMDGVLITQDNIEEYFVSKEMEKDLIPEKAIRKEEELFQRMIANPLDQGVVVTEGMTESPREIEKGMEEPVIAGFMADDLYQVVSGVLRGGDRIHIFTAEKDDGRVDLLWENIYVQEVFNSAGTVIPSQDHSMAAQRINILMEKRDIGEFYAKLLQGSLRIVKVV